MIMVLWQEEIVETSAGVMSKGERRDFEADAEFDEILKEAELAADSAQTPAEELAIEICSRVKAQRTWDSYYEDWELEKLVRIRFNINKKIDEYQPESVAGATQESSLELEEINDIIGDDIPEVIFREGMFCWKLHNRREPLQPFLVCRYEAFERLSQYLGHYPDHVKASLKREPYACFELDLRRASKSHRNILAAN